MMIWFGIVFLCLIQYIAIGISVYEKKAGYKYWLINLIPFVSCFRIDSITKGFNITIFPIKKWGKTVVFLSLVVALFIGLGLWGEAGLLEEEVKYLQQILFIPIIVCMVIFYFGSIGVTLRILQLKNKRFRYDTLVCISFIAIPFLLNLKLDRSAS